MKLTNFLRVCLISSFLLHILIGCNKELQLNNDATNSNNISENERITLTAKMQFPGLRQGNSNTRISLDRLEDKVSLKWEEGDQIQLCYIQGEKKIKDIVTVNSISSDRCEAEFELNIPREITGEKFDLFGIYGGNGLSETDPVLALLPDNTHDDISLENIVERENIMLYFSAKDLSRNNSIININLLHLGSLININLHNANNINLDDINEIRLNFLTNGWSYNNKEKNNTFNLSTNEFSGLESADNFISIKSINNSIVKGGSISFWCWIPIQTDIKWPELKLEIINSKGNTISLSKNSKAPRVSPLTVGKNYIFDAIWDGSELEFTESTLDKGKPRYIWVDAAANFPDFANSKENIKKYLAIAKNSGFTDIVVDVRPTTGDVLFKTSHVDEVKYLYSWISGVFTKTNRTATWDYLQTFIDEGRKQGVRIHAGVNTFVGGTTIDGGTGILFRDPNKKEWATSLNTTNGIVNVMDLSNISTKFLNPANEDVVNFLCNLLSDLSKYDLDGIILDRGRFYDLQADFSPISKSKFEDYLGGVPVQKFPEEVLPKGATILPSVYPTYMKKWLEFRSKITHDFMEKARKAVKDTNPNIKFGVYVGAWYSTYYTVGVNWASNRYNTDSYYNWATSNYNNFGYADLMDHIILGAYARPNRVYGSTEWTMQGFCTLGYNKIMGDCPIVVGGPDVGNWNTEGVTKEEENQAIINSVKACMDASDGYFLFDMIHLKKSNQWKYAKEGIRIAIDD